LSEFQIKNKIFGSYNWVNKFDKNQKDRIKNLLKLNGLCIIEHNYISESCGQVNGEPGRTFFSDIVDISNVVLTWQIFDEISASLDNRGPLGQLIDEVRSDIYNDEDFDLGFEWAYTLAFDDLKHRTFDPDLMYTDFINGSLFQDFIVGTYSAFEYWMTRIYDNTCKDSDVIDRRKEKVIKLIEKKKNTISDANEKGIVENWLVQNQEELSKDIIKKFGSYVSSSEKIDKVISIASKNYSEALRDNGVDPISNDDRNLIKFYAAQRNSIHNLGKHSKSLDISFYGVKIEEGKASYYKDHSDNVNLCSDLINLFVKVVRILNVDLNLIIEKEVLE
jgi:hypothetical protein